MARTRITRLRRKGIAGVMGVAAVATAAALTGTASANHPVFVEGNCFGPGAGMAATGILDTPPLPGLCGDFDGDGLIGAAEDADGDNNYGTINGALAAIAQNGRVTIVANGTYPEIVNITPAAGANVTLEARPGVVANVEAFVQGQAPGPVTGGTTQAQRLGSPGIIVNGSAGSRVQVRNLVTRNWTDGVRVQGSARVILDGIVAEGNIQYGVRVLDDSRAAISSSQINGNGFRAGSGAGPAAPGIGVRFEGTSLGSIYNSTISGNAAAGVRARSQDAVETVDVQAFDNAVAFEIAP